MKNPAGKNAASADRSPPCGRFTAKADKQAVALFDPEPKLQGRTFWRSLGLSHRWIIAGQTDPLPHSL